MSPLTLQLEGSPITARPRWRAWLRALDRALWLCAWLLVGGAVPAATGCATAPSVNAWHQHLHDADAAFNDEQWHEARAIYARLLPMAPDVQLSSYIRLRLALITGYTGDLPGALEQLAELELDTDIHFDDTPSYARYAMAELLEEVGDNRQAAMDLYVDIVVRYPETPAALDALDEVLAAFEDQDDPQAAVEWMSKAWPDLADTTLGDNLLFEMARLFEDELDDPQTASDLYMELRTRYRDGPLADDATLRLGLLLEDAGRDEEALQVLEALAGPHDSSWGGMGTYDSKLKDDAIQARARMFEERGQLDAAIDEYTRLFIEFPMHSEGGKLAWHRAELVRQASGDVGDYREALMMLIQLFDHSIYAERAHWRLSLLDDGTPLDELEAHPMPRERPWLDDPAP